MQNWYQIANIHELDSPALVIYPERVKSNIQTAIQMVGDVKRLRPHIKTNKSLDVVQLMMQAGIYKFKCATIAEAELLGMCQAPDVLLAYQPLGPKLHRLISLMHKYPHTQYACLVDNMATAQAQSAVFEANGLKVSVYIDLNLGMNRTGITPNEKAIALYQYCSQLNGFQSVGLHAYDGHLRHADIAQRTQECNQAFSAVERLKDNLQELGFSKPTIIAGGSPTFPIHCQRPDVECSPGTFVYWDKGYSIICAEQNFLPAALVISRIISLPTPTQLCTDLGHKSIASENSIDKRVFFLDAEDLKPISQSEEHLVMETTPHHAYQVGDVLYGVPYHVCPTITLFERAYTIENGQITGEWKNIGRDRKISV